MNQPQEPLIHDPMFQKPHHPLVVDGVEERLYIGVQYPAYLLALDPDADRVQRIMLAATVSETVRETEKVFLVDHVQHLDHGLLHNLVFYSGDP